MTQDKNPYLNTPKPILGMFLAIKRDDTAALTQALTDIKAQKLDINTRLADGESALHSAVRHMNLGMIDQLLQAGINPDIQNQRKQTALHLAVDDESLSALKAMIKIEKAGANIHLADEYGRTPLHLCKSSHATQYLLQRGANAAVFDQAGNTPLHYYAQRNGKQTLRNQFKAMIERGCDPNIKNREGRTVLHDTLLYLNMEKAKDFIDYGIEVNSRDINGNTLLHAISHSDKVIGLYRELVDLGVDPNSQNYSALTPLHIAASQRNYFGVTELISLGAYVNAQDAEGRTPAHYTTTHPDAHMLDLLLAHGADVNTPNRDGNTILHQMCAINRDVDGVKFLLDHGASVTAKNEDGFTPMAISEQALERYNGQQGQTIYAMLQETYERQTGQTYEPVNGNREGLRIPETSVIVEDMTRTMHQLDMI